MAERSEHRAARYDPLAPATLADPYPAYARLRREDPVHWGAAGDAGLDGRWYITRYADVVDLLKDRRFGREVNGRRLDLAHLADDELPAQVANNWMILRDPPAHTRLRALVQAAYTPRRVAALHTPIAATVNQLIDKLAHQPAPVDLLDAFALPLTVQVTALVLGLPRDDTEMLARWSRAMATMIDFNASAEADSRSHAAVKEFRTYVQEVVAARRRTPRDDLISALLAAPIDGRPPTGDELVGSLTHLLFVGNDPVMHAIGNAVMLLHRHPDQRALFLAHPERTPEAVDELMRFDSPVQMTFRYVKEDLAFRGRQMRAGEHVAVVLGSANRDAACCPEPDRLDVTRPAGQVAHYGFGIHYCLGAPLARLEIGIGLATLLRRLPGLRLAQAQVIRQQTLAVRGAATLPVCW